jgi:hypothetical protein
MVWILIMKFTKISSDKAYKLYKEGNGGNVYFMPSGTIENLNIPKKFDRYPLRAEIVWRELHR